MIAKQERLLQLCKEILRDDYVVLKILRYEIREDLETGESGVTCVIRDSASGGEYTITGSGVGGIDAFFHGLKAHFAREHLSLKTISISDFRARAQMESRQQPDGADAPAHVFVEIENSYGKRFRFDDTSRSVLRSAVAATLEAVEYFVNSERAIIKLHQSIEHARREGRSDTVALATRQMSDLVENTSYTEVVQKIREKYNHR